MKFTNDKKEAGLALLSMSIVVAIVVLALMVFYNRVIAGKRVVKLDVSQTIQQLAIDIQSKKSELKVSRKSEVNSNQTLDYLMSQGVIEDVTMDLYNDMLQKYHVQNDQEALHEAYSNVANARVFKFKDIDYDIYLYSNGNIIYNNQIRGKVMLTDYYADNDLKTIWSQESEVDNNLVKIQVFDGKFGQTEEDNSYKVWKYALESYDDSTHGRFSYWINEYQDVISTEPEIFMSASINRNYTAIYNSEEYIEPGNRITMSYEKVGTGIVGCVEGMHYAKDTVRNVYDPTTKGYKDYNIKGSSLEKIGIVFTLNSEKGLSPEFGCTTTGDDVGYTIIFDSMEPTLNSLVSYNYKNTGTIMISQAINITFSVVQSLGAKEGDTIYMKPFMLFMVGEEGYYVNSEKSYQFVY